ncbi:hypothetical protein BTA51_04860 [Hahella sp. CCB-MM4]|nr:hypothetical protein BTA51_04860 [Hahella sp. CCB-MM4]
MEFPKVTELDVELNSMLPAGATYSLNLGSSRLRIQLHPQQELGSFTYRLAFTLNHFPLELEIDQPLIMALVSSIASDQSLESLPFDQLPAQLQLALLQTVIAPICDQLNESGGMQLHLEKIIPLHQTALSGSRLLCRCSLGDSTGWVAVSFARETIHQLQEVIPSGKLRLPQSQLNIGDLRQDISIQIAGIALNHQQISQLELHDIVLLDQRGASNEFSGPSVEARPLQVQVRTANRCLFYGALRDSMLEVTHINEEKRMDKPIDEIPGETIKNLDEIPMEVVFEIARQTSTISHLKSLVPGQIFALGKRPDSLVTMQVNGQAVAEAELVQINERIGARITRLLVPLKPDADRSARSGSAEKTMMSEGNGER